MGCSPHQRSGVAAAGEGGTLFAPADVEQRPGSPAHGSTVREANAMIAQMMTGGMTADALVLPRLPSIDREVLRLWLTRLLMVAVVLIGVVLTFYILGALGFAVYGLPRSSF